MAYEIYKYYVDNKVKSLTCAIHLLHRQGCAELPDQNRRLYVGHFEDHDEAVASARKLYPAIGLCEVCCGTEPAGITPAVGLIEDGQTICVTCGHDHNAEESESQFAQVVLLSEKHEVSKVLCDYTHSVTMPEEGELKSLVSRLPKNWRMAGLVEKESIIAAGVEDAARLAVENGVDARAFADRDEAIRWLLA